MTKNKTWLKLQITYSICGSAWWPIECGTSASHSLLLLAILVILNDTFKTHGLFLDDTNQHNVKAAEHGALCCPMWSKCRKEFKALIQKMRPYCVGDSSIVCIILYHIKRLTTGWKKNQALFVLSVTRAMFRVLGSCFRFGVCVRRARHTWELVICVTFNDRNLSIIKAMAENPCCLIW